MAKDYNLDAVIEQALAQSKEIRLARAEMENASALKKEALADALPQINLDFNYNYNFMESKFFFTVTDSSGKPQTQSFKTSFENQYQMNATLNQTIYSFGKVGGAIKAAGYYEKYIKNQFINQKQEIVLTAKKGFYQALLTEKIYQVAQASEISAKENYENIQLKYEAGSASEFELLQAEVRWRNSIPSTIEAKKNLELSLNHLKRIISVPMDEKISLSGNFDEYPSLPEKIQVQDVLNERPDYQSLQWEKRMRDKYISIQFANHLPSLQGNLSYQYQGASDDLKLENDNDNLFMGISLKIPIFSGGRTNAQVQKAKIDAYKNQTQIEILKEQIEIDLNNSYFLTQQTYEQIKAAEKGIITAEKTFQLAESRVENGLATQVELKQIRTDYDQALLNYYTAIFNYLNAYFEWEKTTGNIL